jgi:ABC-type branched-subunit amino acid transport system substrate-binding protein
VWPTQLDFSAELSKARAAQPDAIFAFYPGGAGVRFVTQYVPSGLKGQRATTSSTRSRPSSRTIRTVSTTAAR